MDLLVRKRDKRTRRRQKENGRKSKRKALCGIVGGGIDEGVEQVPQPEITTPPLPLVASSLLHVETPVSVSEPVVSTKR